MSHPRLVALPQSPRPPCHAFLLAGLALCMFLAGPAAVRAGPAYAPQKTTHRASAGQDVVEDTRAGLQWTGTDNGADIDWRHAVAWCANKHDGWRLPAIDELATLYVPGSEGNVCAHAVCRTLPGLRLSGSWFWSATPVGKDGYDGDELAWGLLLENGIRTQSVQYVAEGARALCVRGA